MIHCNMGMHAGDTVEDEEHRAVHGRAQGWRQAYKIRWFRV